MDRGIIPENSAPGQMWQSSREKEEERWSAKLESEKTTGLFLTRPLYLFVWTYFSSQVGDIILQGLSAAASWVSFILQFPFSDIKDQSHLGRTLFLLTGSDIFFCPRSLHVCQKTDTSFGHMETSFRGHMEVDLWEPGVLLAGSFSWVLGCRSWPLGAALLHHRKPLAAPPPPYQPMQGVLAHPDFSRGWLISGLPLNHGLVVMWKGRVDAALEN